MSERWLLLETGLGDPAWNMALDEALLATAASRGCGAVRLYGWASAAATFGYSQRYAEVEVLTRLRPLIRRPTGGGLVPHDQDWTYSLSLPPDHAWSVLRARESYRRLHRWVAGALGLLGLEVQLAGERRRPVPGACFAGAEMDDVLLAGRKVAGAAQRRSRAGLLIQGSVQDLSRLAERDRFAEALQQAGEEQWGAGWERAEVPPQVALMAAQLQETRYSRETYHRAR